MENIVLSLWSEDAVNEWVRLSVCVCVFPGDRLRGHEEELAGAVGAIGAEAGDSDWIQDVTENKETKQRCPRFTAAVTSGLCIQRWMI